MNRLATPAHALLLLVFFATTLYSQQPERPDEVSDESLPVEDPLEVTDEEAFTACASCGACGGAMLLIPVVVLVLNIALLVWVARDAKSRGMDSAVLWMLLVMFTSVIGFVIFVLSRPQGAIIQCSSCGNNRLQASRACPHCGNV